MRINIHYKITIIFGTIVAFILCGIYLYLNRDLRDHAFQRARINLKKEASLVKSFLETGMLKGKTGYEMDLVVDDIGANLGLRVTLIDMHGVVLGDSEIESDKLSGIENHLHRPEVQKALHSGFGESYRYSTTLQQDMIYEAYRFGKSKPDGIIRLAAPLSEIAIISGKLKRSLSISLILAFILTIIINFAVSFLISKPINRMSKVATSFAKGYLSERLLVKSKDELGQMANAFNNMADEIKRRIDEVTLSKLRLESVLLSMFEGVMVVDIHGVILLMNERLMGFLHIRESLIGKNFIKVVPNKEICEIAENVLKKKLSLTSREITIFNGEKILLVHATPVLRDRAIEGAVLVFHDMTELRHLENVRKEFVTNVSHELRTPMSSITGYTETLIDGAIDDKANAKKFLDIIYSESTRLARLVDDILDLSQIESGLHKLDLKPCDINSVVEKIIKNFYKQAGKKSVVIKKFIPKGLPDAFADEAKLAQVMINLVENAIKYNNEGGKIFISAKDIISAIKIEVTDTGIGIKEKDQDRIFERFYRTDKARSREMGGTGLGLAIVKHIVQAHNGNVFVKSSVGEGTTFSFTIPKAI